MKLSITGLEVLKKYEGLRLEPYKCPADIPTIGYGNTFYENGAKVKLTDPPISKERAEQLLKNTVKKFEGYVKQYVTREINQNQFDALVLFTYNVGGSAFKSSTLLKRVNANPCDLDIAYQFSRWNKSGGKVLLGLTRRRKEESGIYFS